MKYKITKRLIGYFSVVLLIFSVIIGVLFQILFTRHTAEINQQELKKKGNFYCRYLVTVSPGTRRAWQWHGYG